MTEVDLQAENERLRTEIAAYRAREVADLRTALALAHQEIAEWRAEAHRIATQAQQLAADDQDVITRLRSQLEVKQQVASQLQRSTASANAARN